VVVVGGSRGFGAALVLSLLQAGYDVHALYAVSRDAAADLRVAAGEHAQRLVLHQLDAADASAIDGLVAALRDGDAPLRGVVLNAAPPPLGMRLTAGSAGGLADYVADSLGRVAVPLGGLLPCLDAQDAWLLFCSTAAMSAPPLEWPHYVAAKGAIEGLARWTAAARPDARVIVLRAPKMRTDFTSSPSGAVGAAGADDVAGWLVQQIAGDALPAGLTILDPPPA
jgi:NAD(P)-dependent dehydrogenase (short-subunit alcohol dehydrogenase family)